MKIFDFILGFCFLLVPPCGIDCCINTQVGFIENGFYCQTHNLFKNFKELFFRVLLRTVQIFSCDVRYFMMKMTMYKYLTNNKHINHIKHYLRNCRWATIRKDDDGNDNIWLIMIDSNHHNQHRGLVPVVPDEQEHEQALLCWVPCSPLPQGLIYYLDKDK